MNRPSILTGALWGGLLSAPLIALAYLGQQIAGLPFIPFDFFDWVARVLPGPVITFGIDTMVAIIRGLNLGPTDETAKLGEQTMAIIATVVIGTLAGAVFFAVMNALRRRSNGTGGAILGVILAVPMALISLSVNLNTAADPLFALAFILFLYVAWGVTLGAVYDQLAARAEPVGEPGAVRVEPVDRRQFLIQMGAATAAITVVGAGLGALLGRADSSSAAPMPQSTQDPDLLASLPNANDLVQPAPGTRPELTALQDHYRIDIRAQPLEIPAEGYTLPFTYRGETLASLTLGDIRNNFQPVDAYITMSCISNGVGGDLISTILWTGVPMQDILSSVDVPENATHLKITGGDGFDETVALDLIASDPRIMLAYEWDHQPLPARHGFPLRIHIPNLYGMKQPKWITGIEFIEGDEDGYWVRRGWDKHAVVRATSVIDTVAVDAVYENEDGARVIPIGGIAWAGERGISKVEVRIDGGEWVEAALRSPISERTWQIWRYDWAFSEGSHTFEVRCYEGDSTPQIETPAPVRPSGATGIHSRRATV